MKIVSRLFFFNWLTSSEREYSNQHNLICLWKHENSEHFSLFFISVQNFEIQNRVNKDFSHRSSSSRNTKVVRIDQIVKPNITMSVLVMVSLFLIPHISWFVKNSSPFFFQLHFLNLSLFQYVIQPMIDWVAENVHIDCTNKLLFALFTNDDLVHAIIDFSICP